MAAIRSEFRKGGKRVTIQIDQTWQRKIRVRQRALLVTELVFIVRWLMRNLPKRTGRLRRQTRQVIYAVDRRSFRVWSTVYYSRWVITAPRVWRTANTMLRNRLLRVSGSVKIPMRVSVDGQAVRRETLDYRLSFRKMVPKSSTHALHRLRNEIRGELSVPISMLRGDLIRQAQRAVKV